MLDLLMQLVGSSIDDHCMSGDIFLKVIRKLLEGKSDNSDMVVIHHSLYPSSQSCYHPTQLLQVFTKMDLTRQGWKWRFSLEKCISTFLDKIENLPKIKPDDPDYSFSGIRESG